MRLPRISPRTYRWITLSALIAVAAIVLTGAAVRLTGSGLGCSDWPACSESQFVDVSGFHQAVEQLNRLFTGAISVAIGLAVLGSYARSPRRRDLIWWSWGLVAGLIGQSVLGGVTVLTKLSPQIVMGHFLLSSALVLNAVVLHHRAGHPDTPGVATVAPRVVALSRATVAVGFAVLVTGTVVTGTGPHGGDETVKRLPYEIETVARIHSLTAWLLLALCVVTIGLVHRCGASRVVARGSLVLVAAILVQGAIGYTQYFTGGSPGLVEVHVAGSVVVWIALLSFHLALFAHPEPVEAQPSTALADGRAGGRAEPVASAGRVTAPGR
ncbi:MAG: COX15/CtaA family protein [Acidimicrobiales bacterium]